MKWKVQLVKNYHIEKHQNRVITVEPHVDQLEIIAQEGSQVTCYFALTNFKDSRIISITCIALRNAEIKLYGQVKEQSDHNLECTIECILQEQGSAISVSLLTQVGGAAQQVITTKQIHRAPDTQSAMRIRSVVEDRSHHAYTALIRLEKESLRADATQENKILLLSPTAHATSEPTLEILHDNVQCGHGTAISSLDPEQLFYLAVRGLEPIQAQNVLVKAFLSHQ